MQICVLPHCIRNSLVERQAKLNKQQTQIQSKKVDDVNFSAFCGSMAKTHNLILSSMLKCKLLDLNHQPSMLVEAECAEWNVLSDVILDVFCWWRKKMLNKTYFHSSTWFFDSIVNNLRVYQADAVVRRPVVSQMPIK